MEQYFANYSENGTILGLYNSAKHTRIPEPYIRISLSEKNNIVRSPSCFCVKDGKLVEIEKGPEPVDYSDIVDAYNVKIASGVMVDGVCYYADSEAVVQIVCEAGFIEKEKGEPSYVYAHISGSKTLKAVDAVTFKKVSQAIREYRNKAALEMCNHKQQRDSLE